MAGGPSFRYAAMSDFPPVCNREEAIKVLSEMRQRAARMGIGPLTNEEIVDALLPYRKFAVWLQLHPDQPTTSGDYSLVNVTPFAIMDDSIRIGSSFDVWMTPKSMSKVSELVMSSNISLSSRASLGAAINESPEALGGAKWILAGPLAEFLYDPPGEDNMRPGQKQIKNA